MSGSTEPTPQPAAVPQAIASIASIASIEDSKPRYAPASRLAVLAMFFVNGGIFANWAARIPVFKERFALDEGQLGFTLLAISAGVICSLIVASGLISRWGSRAATIGGAAGICLGLALIPFMPSWAALWVMLFAFGAMTCLMDMAMNAQAAEVERRRGKPTMSSFHASFSAGGIAGALLGSLMAGQNIQPMIHFGIAAAAFGLLAIVSAPALVHVAGEKRDGEPTFALPPRALWPLGAMALFSALGEGAMFDWSAVYLQDSVHTAADFAALGFASFSVTMTLGRVSGDWLAHRFKPTTIVRIGGVVAGSGLLAAMLLPNPPVVLLGFGAVGIGLANVVPLAFSAAGNLPGIASSRGITGVATIAYAAFLAGPPLIGQLAQATSLRLSLSVVAVLVGSIVLYAGALRRAALPAPPPA
jgi:predicted MFS family arabinose efflux permease